MKLKHFTLIGIVGLLLSLSLTFLPYPPYHTIEPMLTALTTIFFVGYFLMQKSMNATKVLTGVAVGLSAISFLMSLPFVYEVVANWGAEYLLTSLNLSWVVFLFGLSLYIVANKAIRIVSAILALILFMFVAVLIIISGRVFVGTPPAFLCALFFVDDAVRICKLALLIIIFIMQNNASQSEEGM